MSYKKGDRLTVTISDTGVDGEGIGKVDGYTLFIKDAVIGDVVECKIMKAKKNYAYAHLEKIIEASPYRITPPCQYARSCGGCQIQALDYNKQLEFKQEKVRNNLIRIGGFDPEYIDSIMEPIIGMEDPYHYRGKAQFPFGYNKEGEIVTGFYAGRTHSIISNTDCIIGVNENKIILETILDFMREYDVSAYKEESGDGLIRHVLIRKGFHTEELMVCLVINTLFPEYANHKEYIPAQGELIRRLSEIKNMTSLSVSLNAEKTNVIMGREVHTIWGEDVIHDTIRYEDMEVTYAISPLSFYQVNPKQTERLYGKALEYANLTGKESVWDLYCGIGTISLFLAGKARQVYGVEIVPQAIDDAVGNARANNIDNARFFVGKAEEVLPKYYNGEMDAPSKENESGDEIGAYDMTHPDVIVVDPPRKGCDEACLDTMLKMAPDRIVYVSCDSATLARDLKILTEGGYRLKGVCPVDQFPHSVHIESVAWLGRA